MKTKGAAGKSQAGRTVLKGTQKHQVKESTLTTASETNTMARTAQGSPRSFERRRSGNTQAETEEKPGLSIVIESNIFPSEKSSFSFQPMFFKPGSTRNMERSLCKTVFGEEINKELDDIAEFVKQEAIVAGSANSTSRASTPRVTR